ncbi:MAG: LPS export ABC transporter periplasmic protein LptC [Burkholderiales bacterium]
MNGRALPILPVGVLLLLLALSFWLSQYVTNEGAGTRELGRNDPDVVVERFVARKLTPAGDVQYILIAETMTHFPVEDVSKLDKVVFTAMTPGQPQLVAKSPTARLISGGNEIMMEGGVVIDSSPFGNTPAMKLRTPRLTVLPEKNTASSKEGVVIESSQGVMNAASFELNSLTQTLRMEKMRATLTNGK